MKRYLWILLTAPGLAMAQAGTGFATPTLGYVYDSDAQALRALEGVPGAAVLGDRLHLDTLFDAIAVSPNRRYALGSRTGEAKQALIRLDGRTGVALPSDVPAGRVFFSPGGGTLAVVRGDAIEIWTGLPDNPNRLRSLQAGLGGEVNIVAVSDDGGAVAALAGGALWSLDEQKSQLGDGYRDMQFLRSTQDLVALGASRLMVFRKVSRESASEPAEEFLGIETGKAFAFALSRDENTVALLEDGSVSLIQLDSKAVATLALEEMEGARLSRAEGNAVFQLRAANGIWVLDGDSPLPRVMVVDVREGEAQ